MGSTVSYTDLRENLEKGVCRHGTPDTAPQPAKSDPNVRSAGRSVAGPLGTITPHKGKAVSKPWCAELAWETWLSQYSKG